MFLTEWCTSHLEDFELGLLVAWHWVGFVSLEK